jgi:hypothetical protein
MTESGHMDALTALLEERKQYETWIAQLDARRGSAPGHVLERVRGDYAARLGQVTEQLVLRAPELRSSAHELAVRLAAIERDEGEKRDERAEYELRAAVGEYAPEVAHASFARCDDAISRLAADRQAIEGELNRMRGVLAAIDAAAAGLSAPTSAAQSPEQVRDRPAAVDELAFLKSVSLDQRLTPVLASPQIAAPPAVDEAAPNEEHMEDPTPSFGAMRRPMEAAERRPASSLVAGTMTPGSLPSILQGVPTEQVKTLRCQECGTMNYPTEWYCERCGGELAAM